MLPLLGNDHYKLIIELVNHEGKLPYRPDISFSLIDFCLISGIAFPIKIDEKKYLYMADEVRNIFEDMNLNRFKKQCEDNSKLIRIAYGMTNLYGAIDFDSFIRIYNRLTKIKIERKDLIDLLSIEMYTQNRIALLGHFLFDQSIEDEISEIIIQHMRMKEDYYPFTLSQYQNAANPHYLEKNQYTFKFTTFLTSNYDVTFDEANYTTLLIVKLIKLNIIFGRSCAFC